MHLPTPSCVHLRYLCLLVYYILSCREFSLIGLALIAIGTGGIKPCVSAFGGDQFKLPEQARQLQTFFSVFYFSINAGSLIRTVITPILREVSQYSKGSNHREDLLAP